MADISNSDARASRRFIEALDPERDAWVIGAPGLTGGWRWETFHGPLKGPMAERWMARRYSEGLECWMVLGDVGAPVSGREVPTNAVKQSRFAAAVAAREDAFLTRAAGAPLTIYRDRAGRIVAVWKLAEPMRPTEAGYAAGKRAADCCTAQFIVQPQLHYIPLPGDMRPRDLRGSIVRFPVHGRVVFEAPGVMQAATGGGGDAASRLANGGFAGQAPRFIRGDSLAFNNLKWLWPNLLLANAFSLVGGEAGVGKSTVCATIAAAVTVGGVWPTGEAIEPGAVVYCEIEDDLPSVTGPALAAAGANMSRIDFCEAPFDLAADIRPLVSRVAALERDCGVKVRLIVLSPVRNFFGAKESYIDSEVRARLHRICEWAQANDVAILGILHPKQQAKDAFAGASAWKDVARAGIFCKWTGAKGGARHIEPLKTNSGKYGWRLPFAIEGAWPGGFESKRVVWLAKQPEGESDAGIGDDDDVDEERRDEDIDEGPGTGGQKQVARACQFLLKALAPGPRLGAELKAEAAELGIAGSTLDRAADEFLGVVKTAAGPRKAKTWSLP